MLELVSKIIKNLVEICNLLYFRRVKKNCHDKAAIAHCSSSEYERNTCRRKSSKIHTKLMVLGNTYIRDN